MPPFSAPRPQKVSYVDLRVTDLVSKVPERVLAAAGDLLRRTEAHPYPAHDVEQALSSMASAEVRAAVATIELRSCTQALERAASAAFEAAFADTPAETELYAEQAEADLMMRDRAESIVAAARRVVEVTADAAARAELEAACAHASACLAEVDASSARHMRSLTGINARRRVLLEELDASHRSRASWLSVGLDSDELLRSLAGDVAPTSPSARAAAAASSLPSFVKELAPGERGKPSSASVARFADADSSALFRACLGTATRAESDFVAARASHDPALREALDLSTDVALEDARSAGDESV